MQILSFRHDVGLRLLSEVEIALILSIDNPLDFHPETYSRYCVIDFQQVTVLFYFE